jgi:ligand-binding sensor domain-containing protein
MHRWGSQLGKPAVRAVALAPDGTLWLGTGNGAVYFDPGKARP